MIIVKLLALAFSFIWSVEVIPMLGYYQLMIKKIRGGKR